MHEPPSDDSSQEQPIKDSSIKESQLQTGQSIKGDVNQVQGLGSIIRSIVNLQVILVRELKSTDTPKRQSPDISLKLPELETDGETNNFKKHSFPRNNFKTVSIINLTVFGLIIALRWLGLFESFELKAFDTLMRQRYLVLKEQPDNRILIIQATEEDIQEQAQLPNRRASLSEDTLNRLFEKLKQYEPQIIGLNIYRDFPVGSDSNYAHLKSALQQPNLFGVCKVRNGKSDPLGVAPPPEIPENRLGFTDAVVDEDGILRRHLLSRSKSEALTDKCITTDNLSVLLALSYLDKVRPNFPIEVTPQGNVKIENVVLPQMHPYTGGYQRVDAGGRQIMLNYRSLNSPLEISHTVSISEVINDQIPPKRIDELKGRIILIGISGPRNTSSDYWLTPYSKGQPIDQEQISGVVVQAHMVSQILSAVLNNRPLIWSLSETVEFIWIGGWTLVGSILACKVASFQSLTLLIRYSVISTGLAFLILYGSCYLLLTFQGGWLPLFPAGVGLFFGYICCNLFHIQSPLKY